MEEVDRILIHALRQAGTPVPPHVQAVGAFPPELLLEAAARCLGALRPALAGPPGAPLPPGAAARFRLASRLAAACRELGFPGDVGYQSFLYSSERGRRLLLFLVEKLPRDEDDGADGGDEPPGNSGTLLRAVGSRIREQLATPWVPPRCRPRLQRLQGTGHLRPFSTCPLVLPHRGPPELQEFFKGAAPPVPAQPPLPHMAPPALLETHAAQVGAQRDWEAEWGGAGLASRLAPQEYVGRKRLRARLRALESLRQARPRDPPGGAPLDPAWLQGGGPGGGPLPKGSRFTRAQRLTHEQDPQVLLQQVQVAAETPAPSKDPEEGAAEAAALEAALARLEAALEARRGEARAVGLALGQAEAAARQHRAALGARRDALRLKAQALELLPDARGNMAKLQGALDAGSRRLLGLAAQWERRRGPLLAELRQLRALRRTATLESSRRLSQIRAHERSRAAAAEARSKEELCRQL
ncbi:LOW QUALITY PROTEIN: coiled-coil domain-containing protein 22-like, partial [Eudromia elegans]